MSKNTKILNFKKRKDLENDPIFDLSPSERKLCEISICTLINALEAKDPYTKAHSLRVAHFSLVLGREIKLSEKELYLLELASVCHDLGKISTPDNILKKPERLDHKEFEIMKDHPHSTFEILKDFGALHNIATYAMHHHERFDGRGYPLGLKGEDIPLFSRIILISDTFDAMTSTRPYRKGLPCQVAFNELLEFSGTQFDARLAKAFIKSMEKSVKDSDHFQLSFIPGSFKKIAA